MCSTLQSGRLQLLLRQSQALPRNRLLSCFPVSTATAAAARLNIHHVSHYASGSSPIPALRRRHVLLAPSAVVPAAAAATTAINPWQTLAVLCTCAAAAQAAEGHTAWGRLLSAPLLTLLLALGAATLGLLPVTSAVYDVVWSHLMPLAIALFLLDHDVSNIRQAGGPVLASFLLGAGTMIAGAVAAWLLCKSAMAAAAGSTAAAAKLAACLVASYIGGSVNFIAVAAATQLPTSLVPGAMAADNLGMLLLLGLLMAVPLRLLQQQQQPQLQLALADVPIAPPTSSSSGSGGGGSGMWPQQQRCRGTPMAGGRPGSSRSTYTVAASATAAGASPGGPSGDTTSSSSGGGSSSSSEDEWVALDGSPLLTQPPTPLEVSTALDEISQGENHTRVLPVNLSGKRSSGSSSGSSSRPGVALSDGMIALDGTPLLTQPPSESDVELALDEIRHGENHTRVLPVLPKVGDGTTTSSSSGGGGGGVEPVAAPPMGPKCGGCPGSGVTANDDNPLLTRVPSMGDGVSSIIAAKEGKQQLRTPPKPPSPTFNKSGRTAATAAGGSNGNRGYNSQRGPDGQIIGCGGCSEALDSIAAKSPLPAAIAAGGWGGSNAAAAGSSGSSSVLALDGSPLLTQPPSQSEVSACIEETRHGENHTRVLPVLLKVIDSSSSSSSSSSSTGSSGSGALALDGGMLLTEEPDIATVAAAVEAARKGGSNGSSVAVSPLVSGEFELLVKLDRDSLMQRLRHQQRKYKKQQQKQQLGSTAAAAASSSSYDSGSDSSSSSSDDDDLLANDGSPLLTQPPSGFEVAACLKETSNGNNQTRMLPVLPRLNNSSDSGSSSGRGALALDGSMLLTDEPDSARLAAEVVAACKGSSSGSSVAVSPVVSGDYESLVRLDKETLMKRLRHQQRKVKKQQQLGTASAAVGSSYDSSSSSSSSSDDEDLRALDGSLLLTQPPSQVEVAMCVAGASQGDNQTRVLPVLPKASSSSSSRSKGNDDDRDDNDGSSGGSSAGTSTAHKAGPTTATAASGSVQRSSSSSSSSSDGVLTASTAAAAVAAAAVAAAVSNELATVFSTPALHQLFLAATAVGISAAATAVSKMQQPSAAAGTAGGPGPFSGASQLGQVLIGVFFAALGASCCCPLSTLACCLPLLSFITVMTATHWVLLWVVGGRVLGLQPEVLLCGSAAAIGGPATAAGLASAKGWGHLVQPSLLCGSLGYALGTGAGLAVAQGIGALA